MTGDQRVLVREALNLHARAGLRGRYCLECLEALSSGPANKRFCSTRHKRRWHDRKRNRLLKG